MQHYAAFHAGLRCLEKYLFKGLQRVQGSAQYISIGGGAVIEIHYSDIEIS